MKNIYLIMLLSASFYSASAMDNYRPITLASSDTLYYRLEDLGHGDFAKETQITLMFGELKDTFDNIIYRLEHALFSYGQTYREKTGKSRLANYMIIQQPEILKALLLEHPRVYESWLEHQKNTPQANPTLLLLEEKGFLE